MLFCCGAGDCVGTAVDAIERLWAAISLRRWFTVSSRISAFSSLDLVFPQTRFLSSSRWLFIRSLRLFSIIGLSTYNTKRKIINKCEHWKVKKIVTHNLKPKSQKSLCYVTPNLQRLIPQFYTIWYFKCIDAYPSVTLLWRNSNCSNRLHNEVCMYEIIVC